MFNLLLENCTSKRHLRNGASESEIDVNHIESATRECL